MIEFAFVGLQRWNILNKSFQVDLQMNIIDYRGNLISKQYITKKWYDYFGTFESCIIFGLWYFKIDSRLC